MKIATEATTFVTEDIPIFARRLQIITPGKTFFPKFDVGGSGFLCRFNCTKKIMRVTRCPNSRKWTAWCSFCKRLRQHFLAEVTICLSTTFILHYQDNFNHLAIPDHVHQVKKAYHLPFRRKRDDILDVNKRNNQWKPSFLVQKGERPSRERSVSLGSRNGAR